MRVSEGVCPELNSWILGYMLKYLHIMRSNNRPALLIFARHNIINATRWLKNLHARSSLNIMPSLRSENYL